MCIPYTSRLTYIASILHEKQRHVTPYRYTSCQKNGNAFESSIIIDFCQQSRSKKIFKFHVKVIEHFSDDQLSLRSPFSTRLSVAGDIPISRASWFNE